MSKMADERPCRSLSSRRGLGVKVQDIAWFPGGIVLIERELPKRLFITTRQKEQRKSGKAFVKITKCAALFLPRFSNTGTSFL